MINNISAGQHLPPVIVKNDDGREVVVARDDWHRLFEFLPLKEITTLARVCQPLKAIVYDYVYNRIEQDKKLNDRIRQLVREICFQNPSLPSRGVYSPGIPELYATLQQCASQSHLHRQNNQVIQTKKSYHAHFNTYIQDVYRNLGHFCRDIAIGLQKPPFDEKSSVEKCMDFLTGLSSSLTSLTGLELSIPRTPGFAYYLPPMIGRCTSLRSLCLKAESPTEKFNRFILCPQFARLKSLKRFECDVPIANALPWGDLPLERLKITPLFPVPPDIKKFSDLTHLELDLSYQKDPILPDTIGDLKHLESLKIRGDILKLPDSLRFLQHLKYVEVDSKNITEAPEWASNHPNWAAGSPAEFHFQCSKGTYSQGKWTPTKQPQAKSDSSRFSWKKILFIALGIFVLRKAIFYFLRKKI